MTKTIAKKKGSGGAKSLQAQLQLQNTGVLQQSKLIKRVDVSPSSSKDSRRTEAKQARTVGALFAYPVGGAHKMVVKFNADIRDKVYLESNHSPPNDSYTGTKYDVISINDRPAHAMMFYHHRSPSGQLGGASSTGGSAVNKDWSADKLRSLMAQGKYGEAMMEDFKDLLNTTAPNRGYYALGLWRAALYAFKSELIGEGELGEIGNMLLPLITGPNFTKAMADYEAAMGYHKV